MERNANYALVGFAALMLFIGMIVFVVWLARVQFAQQYDVYDVIFDGPVDGLSVGGEVHFNGIKVGEITSIGLVKTNPKQVDARVRVTSDVPIREDSYATAEPQGITGVSYIQITPGTASLRLLKDVPHQGKYPILGSRKSALSNLLTGGGTVVTSAIETLNRINQVLSDENIREFSATMTNIRDVSAEMNRRKQLFADADRAINNIDQAATSIKQLGDNANGLMASADTKRTLHNAADAAEQIKEAADQAKQLIAKLQGPTSNFTNNELPQLGAAVETLQRAAESLNRLSNELQQSPQSLIDKAPPKQVEVRP